MLIPESPALSREGLFLPPPQGLPHSRMNFPTEQPTAEPGERLLRSSPRPGWALLSTPGLCLFLFYFKTTAREETEVECCTVG